MSWLLDAHALIALGRPPHKHHRLLALNFASEQVLGRCAAGGLLGHRQLSDACLLATAARHGVRLVTFDSGIAQLLATDKEREQLLSVLH